MSHVAYEWVMSHTKQSCLHINESRLIWMSHVSHKSVLSPYEPVPSHMNESRLIWISHVSKWLSHVAYEWVTSHIKQPCLHMNESRLISISHSSLIDSPVSYQSLIWPRLSLTWLPFTWDMTHSRLISITDINHWLSSHKGVMSHMNVTCLT